MKYSLTILFSLFLSLLISAQQQFAQDPDDRIQNTVETTASSSVDYRSSNGTFWLEDFSAGFPALWSKTNPDGLCPWQWSTDGSYGWFNGNNGTNAGTAIASTTASNGFLIADNDSANHVNFGQPSGTTYQYIDTYFTTNAIDLSSHLAVKLEFEQFLRFNNDVDLEVMVSTDSTFWTTWKVQGHATNNTASSNAETVGINISNIAGGSSTVYIRIGWSSRVYFWMIDDMRIVEAPSYDVVMTAATYSEWIFNQVSDYATLECSKYPVSQIRPMNMKGSFLNDGVLPHSNVTLHVDVTDGNSNNIFSGSNSRLVVNPGSMDSLYVSGFTPGSSIGRYTVHFQLTADSTDSDTSNNSTIRWFEISNHVMARDTGALDGSSDNQGDAFELGNWFNIQNQDELLYGIDVALDNATDPGTLIYGVVRNASRDAIEETIQYEIQASDLNSTGGSKFITLKFDTPVPLNQGEDYLIMVGHYGGADEVFIGTSGRSLPQTSLIYDDPVASWFYVTATPMVRMNFDPTVGIAVPNTMSSIGLEQSIPNPATDHALIRFNLEQENVLVFELCDTWGRTVHTKDLGNLAAGDHSIELDLDGLSDGVYHYSLLTASGRVSRRMMIRN